MKTSAARPHEKARRRHVGRADARVQRGSGVLVDRVADDIRRAAAHDLPVLRSVRVRRVRDCAKPFERLAHGRYVAGRRVSGDSLDQARGGPRRRPGAGASRAVGRRAVAGAQEGIEKRNPKSIAIDVSRVFAFNDGLSAGELEGMRDGLGPEVDREVQARRRSRARSHRHATARGGRDVPQDAAGRVGDHRHGVLERR